MSDNDLIRRGDAFAVVKGLRLLEEDIRNLPAVTVGVPLKQIGTGLYEQPAPEHVTETPKTEHDAGNVLTPAPDAAFASGFKAGLKAAAEHWFRGVSGVRQLLPETKAQILAIPCPQPAPTAQLNAGDVREAALREAAAVVRKCGEEFLGQGGKSQAKALALAYLDILALLEKPHDRT